MAKRPNPIDLSTFLEQLRERFEKPLSETMLFFQPVGDSSYAWEKSFPTLTRLRQQLSRVAIGIAAALTLAILSGISLTSLAALLISGFFILLIMNRVLGIEIVLPNIRGFAA